MTAGSVVLGGGLGQDSAGQLLALAIAQARWRQVAGDAVAARTAVLGLAAGTLTVGVPNEAWRSRLRLERPHLLAAFAARPAGEPVRRLAVTVVAPEVLSERSSRAGRARRPAPGRSTPPPPLDDVGRAALGAFDRPETDELRAVFESWMRHVRRRRG